MAFRLKSQNVWCRQDLSRDQLNARISACFQITSTVLLLSHSPKRTAFPGQKLEKKSRQSVRKHSFVNPVPLGCVIRGGGVEIQTFFPFRIMHTCESLSRTGIPRDPRCDGLSDVSGWWPRGGLEHQSSGNNTTFLCRALNSPTIYAVDLPRKPRPLASKPELASGAHEDRLV